MLTCAFTGHRPDGFLFGYDEDNPLCKALKFALQREIRAALDMGAERFLTGCALGVDMWAAETVIKLKRSRPEIQLIGAIPFRGQELRWSAEQRRRYEDILSSCDEVTVICEAYSKGAYLKRDRYMADAADMVIAVYDRSKAYSGTGYTIRYAVSKSKPVVIIDPKTLDVEKINF